MPATAICLGAVGAGKTRLLTQLQLLQQSSDSTNSEDEKEPLPTVGINHFDIKQPKTQENDKCFSLFFPSNCFRRRQENSDNSHKLSIREFGGALQAAWLTYLKGSLTEDLKGVIYVIDASASARFSEAGVHLIDVINSLERSRLPIRVLIVFSKVDLVEESCKDRILTEARTLLRLDHLSKWCKFCTFEQKEYSAVVEEDFRLSDILNWCQSLLI